MILGVNRLYPPSFKPSLARKGGGTFWITGKGLHLPTDCGTGGSHKRSQRAQSDGRRGVFLPPRRQDAGSAGAGCAARRGRTGL